MLKIFRLLERSSESIVETFKDFISSVLHLMDSYVLTDSINQTLRCFQQGKNKQIPECLKFLAGDDVINIVMIREPLTNLFFLISLQRGYFCL